MKKTIIIATAILIFVIVITALLSLSNKSTQQPSSPTTVTPTLLPARGGTNTAANRQIINAAKTLAPYETSTFKYNYSATDNKIVVLEKTAQGKSDFAQWITQKGLPELVNNTQVTSYQSGSGSPFDYYNNPKNNFILGFFNIFSDISNELQKGNGLTPSPTASPKNSPTPGPSTKNKPPGSVLGEKVYYGQCSSEYGSISLSGGDLCQCGCGETTVAMIASSYVSKENNPKKIVDIYRQNGYSMCGTYPGDARSVLESLGLKTTDYIIDEYPPIASGKVVSTLKKYLDGGWTLMVLAYYKPNEGGGHYFWITDIDSNGNILAYDPYYGQGESPPISENRYSPFPEYARVFGVKL